MFSSVDPSSVPAFALRWLDRLPAASAGNAGGAGGAGRAGHSGRTGSGIPEILLDSGIGFSLDSVRFLRDLR